MKKTVKINVSGFVFTIDDDAFEILNKYIDRLNLKFTDTAEGKEIVSDIESRIAELAKERLSANKEVLTLSDVNEIISILGSPEDFDTEGDEVGSENIGSFMPGRKLYRDPEDRVLGGVCGGLSHFFGIDPIIIRILFVVAFFGLGTGFLVYIILWIVIPEAVTTSQKLAMKGEPITVSNIEKSLKNEFENVKSSFNRFSTTQAGQKARNATQSVGNGLLSVMKALGRLFVVLFGFFVILTGISLLFGLSVSFMAATGFLAEVGFTEFEIIPSILGHVFENSEITLFILSIILLIGIPILALVYWGFKLIFQFKVNDKSIGIIGLTSWVLGLLMVFSIGIYMMKEFKNTSTNTKTENLANITSDTLVIESFKSDLFSEFNEEDFGPRFQDFSYLAENGQPEFYIRTKMDIQQSQTDSFELVINYVAHGNSKDSARINGDKIIYQWKQEGNKLVMNPYFKFPASAKWRNQRVRVTLKVPINKTVYFGNNADEVLYDIRNLQDYWDGDMMNKYWVMTKDGLSLSGAPIPEHDQNFENEFEIDSIQMSDEDLKSMKEEL